MDAIDVVSGFIDAAERAYDTGNEELLYSRLEDSSSLDRQERVWQVYLQAAKQLHGEEKINAIMQKWQINPGEHPLSSRVILHIESMASLVKVDDIRKKVFDRSISDLHDQEIYHFFAACNPINYHGFKNHPQLTSVPSEALARVWYNPSLMDREIAQACSEMISLESEEATDEFIAKVLIARELEKGTVIPYKTQGKLVFYYVYDTIITGEGMVAYALKPVSEHNQAAPILAFRGTQFNPSGLDMLSTLINDCESEIGLSGYLSGRERIAKLLKDPSFCPASKRAKLVGFSLGATFAERLMIDFPHRIKEAVLFSALGIEPHRVKQYAEWIREHGDEYPVRIAHYRVDGDCFDCFGEALIGIGVEHPQSQVSLTYIYPHSCLNLPVGGYAHSCRFFSGDHDYFDIETITSQKHLEQHLYNDRRGLHIRVLQAVGLCFRVPGWYIFQGMRFISRSLFSWRGAEQVQPRDAVPYEIFKTVHSAS